MNTTNNKMNTTENFHSAEFTHVGYNNTDRYGSDGWWEEGNSAEECDKKAEQGAKECDFPDDPELTVVALAELDELDDDDFDSLVSQWGLARSNGWTTNHADLAIHAEWSRRDEPRIYGRAATKALNTMEIAPTK